MLPSCLPASCIRRDSSLVNFVSRTSLAFPVIDANFPFLLNILVFLLFKTLSALTPHVFFWRKGLRKVTITLKATSAFLGGPKIARSFPGYTLLSTFEFSGGQRQMWMCPGVKSTEWNLTPYSIIIAHTGSWRDPTPTSSGKSTGCSLHREQSWALSVPGPRGCKEDLW